MFSKIMYPSSQVMKKYMIFCVLLLLPLLTSCAKNHVYIVYFGEHSAEKALHEREQNHHSYLLSIKKNKEEAKASLLYSYKHSINGFAALLTKAEASKLSKLDEVVSVIRSYPKKYSPHTTRSWEFVGLAEGEGRQRNSMGEDDLLRKARYGSEVIVGILDSGVWPESQSFNDEEMGPVPNSWRGVCQTGYDSFRCNRKLIGARVYIRGFEQQFGRLNTSVDVLSPRDMDGHGTHTASTVAGSKVPKAAALGGLAYGTASGGAPLAHLAIYKVCWAIPGKPKAEGNICMEEDMLAAIDDAIADGVHVLSISIGATNIDLTFKDDGIAIGALHAAKNNIFVSCSAGNFGPALRTAANAWPWIITVGASSLDRAFVSAVVLGNGMRFVGHTVTPYDMQQDMYPLVFAQDVEFSDLPKPISGECLGGTLSAEKTRGKIVVCKSQKGDRIEKGVEVKRAGGVGLVLVDIEAGGGSFSSPDDAHVLPATTVSSNDALSIYNYIRSTRFPMATILPPTTVLPARPAPSMAFFSSRGPNAVDQNILKPDITAPGVNILAAWSEASSPSKFPEDGRVVKFNIESGTSMACPHVAATAALLRAIHPDWSTAAVKSALMTTAATRNNMDTLLTDYSGEYATPFAYGSGHINPINAADPGLVYDSSYPDYLLYLCSLGITNVDPTFQCPGVVYATNNLNYPSLAIPRLIGTVTVTRTVTNVGGSATTYYASVEPPPGFSVGISPDTLFFAHVGQQQSFTITVQAQAGAFNYYGRDQYAFGWYTWNDGSHMVRSPIAVSLP